MVRGRDAEASEKESAGRCRGVRRVVEPFFGRLFGIAVARGEGDISGVGVLFCYRGESGISKGKGRKCGEGRGGELDGPGAGAGGLWPREEMCEY